MSRRFALTFALTMSLFMSVFMSGVVTAINLGVDRAFVGHWLDAWLRVFPIAFAAILVFRPLATRITVALVGAPPVTPASGGAPVSAAPIAAQPEI